MSKVLVNDKYKFNLINNAKCGCTTLRIWFRATMEDISFKEANFFRIHDYVAEKYGKMTFNDRYISAIFGRNPYARVVSAYFDKVHNPRNTLYYDSQLSSLEKFVDKLYNDSEFLYGDDHWKPQVTVLKDSQIFERDIIKYRLENLADDLNAFSLIINCPQQKVINTKKRKRRYRKPWELYYSDELREKVYSIYEEDFLYFNYEPTFASPKDKESKFRNLMQLCRQ